MTSQVISSARGAQPGDPLAPALFPHWPSTWSSRRVVESRRSLTWAALTTAPSSSIAASALEPPRLHAASSRLWWMGSVASARDQSRQDRGHSPSSHSAPPIFQRAVGTGPLAFSCLVLLWDQSSGANAFWASSQGSWFVDCHRPFPRFSQGPCTRWAKVLHSCRTVLPVFQLSFAQLNLSFYL